MQVWTDELEEKLATIWNSTQSAADMVKLFPGFSRNAIIGKAYRLGLPAKSPPTGPRRRKVNPVVRLKKPPAEVKVAETIEPSMDEKTWIPFMEVNDRTCRSILGQNPKDGLALFCPNPKEREMSYCPYHIGIYYNPQPSRWR